MSEPFLMQQPLALGKPSSASPDPIRENDEIINGIMIDITLLVLVS